MIQSSRVAENRLVPSSPPLTLHPRQIQDNDNNVEFASFQRFFPSSNSLFCSPSFAPSASIRAANASGRTSAFIGLLGALLGVLSLLFGSAVVSLGGRGGGPTVAHCQTAGRRMPGGLAVAGPREVAGSTAQAVARGALRPSSSPSVLRSSSISGQWMP